MGFLILETFGELAQLARAPALQAGGHRFDSDILHQSFHNGENWNLIGVYNLEIPVYWKYKILYNGKG